MISDTDTQKCSLCKEISGCISLILIVETGGFKLRPQWDWRRFETEILLYSTSYAEGRKEARYFLMQVTCFCSALYWNRAKCSISAPLPSSWGTLVNSGDSGGDQLQWQLVDNQKKTTELASLWFGERTTNIPHMMELRIHVWMSKFLILLSVCRGRTPARFLLPQSHLELSYWSRCIC